MQSQLLLDPVHFLGWHLYIAGEDLQHPLVTVPPRMRREAVQEIRDCPLCQLRAIEQHDDGPKVALRDLDSIGVGEEVV